MAMVTRIVTGCYSRAILHGGQTRNWVLTHMKSPLLHFVSLWEDICQQRLGLCLLGGVHEHRSLKDSLRLIQDQIWLRFFVVSISFVLLFPHLCGLPIISHLRSCPQTSGRLGREEVWRYTTRLDSRGGDKALHICVSIRCKRLVNPSLWSWIHVDLLDGSQWRHEWSGDLQDVI